MGNETIECPVCDAPGCTVKPGGRGGFSSSCPSCGYQGFMRTPKAAGAMLAKLEGKKNRPAPAAKPAAKPAGDDDGKFSIEKL